MRTFDAVNCGARRKSGKREIVRKRTEEGEILSRAIAASALVRRARKKNVRPYRVEPRYRSQRSTCDLERDRVHPPRFEGSQSPACDHVVLGGGFHGPRLSRSTDRTKRARRRTRENEGRTLSRFVGRQ